MYATDPEVVSDIALSTACELHGGPPSLHTEMIYTKTEISTICDALVAPLAREIHSLDDENHIESMVCSEGLDGVPAGCEYSLGGLLHDVCAKFVPLTVALQDKRRAAKFVIDSIRKNCFQLLCAS